MSMLLELHNLRRRYPNNHDFAEAVTKYLNENKTCCSNPDNLEECEDKGGNPYNIWVKYLKCKKCGKIVEVINIDKS